MTKKEIVRTISEEIGLTQRKTQKIVQKTIDTIIEVLATDGRVELRNFGVFEVKVRPARDARNPRTGEPVRVPEKSTVSFKPGKDMELRIRELKEHRIRGAELPPFDTVNIKPDSEERPDHRFSDSEPE